MQVGHEAAYTVALIMKKLSPSCAGITSQVIGNRGPAGDLDQAEACALRAFVWRNAETVAIHLAKLIGAFRLQKIDPLDKLGGLVRGDEIAGYDIHAGIILGNHDDAEGRLFPVGRRAAASASTP